jgi:hypothetical protein
MINTRCTGGEPSIRVKQHGSMSKQPDGDFEIYCYNEDSSKERFSSGIALKGSL